MLKFHKYHGPTGGHGEPSKGFTGQNHIYCDYCNKEIYTEKQSKIYTPRHIHLANDTDICYTCAKEFCPSAFTENGWPK